jgi:branched-chain amino acid transport system substrate-binding protein
MKKAGKILLGVITSLMIFAMATDSLAQTPSKAPSEVKIGWLGGITGILAEFALDCKKGTEVAVEEINASGGVLGKPVNVIFADTKTDPQIAVQAAQRMIISDKVVAIIGDFFSPNTLALLDVVEKAKMPLFSPNSNATEITQKGKKYIFRNVIPSTLSAEVIAKYAIENLGLKSFVIFAGTDAYTRSNGDAFKKVVEDSKKAEIRGYETYDRATTRDFTNLLLKYKDKQPEGIFTAGGPSDAGLIIKQARELGLTGQFLGTLSQAKKVIFDLAGKSAAGMYLSNEYPGDAANVKDYAEKATIDYIDRWTKRFGSPPPYDTAHGYDAAKVVAYAINKAGSLDGEAIRNQLVGIKGYPGVVGSLTIEPNGDGFVPVYIMQWKEDGKIMIVKGRK